MTVFLIILAVIVLIVILILSLSATLTLVYDNGWHTTIQVLFIKKDIILSDVLTFLLFPEKKAEEARDKADNKKSKAKDELAQGDVESAKELENDAEKLDEKAQKLEEKAEDSKKSDKPSKPNYFKKLWDEQGIVGIMSFATNLIESASSAVTTLFKGFHIYSLYVKMIIGGNDAADIAQDYGLVCSVYYPLKGIILNGMRVDNYDDYVQPDFIAPRNEYEFQLIGSLSVGLIVKMALKAGFVFLKNFIKDK